jgi:hypothetical protein
VLEEAFDEPALCQLRLSQEKQLAPPGIRLQQLDKIYVDVITLRKRNDAAHTRSRSTCRPSLRSTSSTASACCWPRRWQVRIIVMLCTTAQSTAIKVSVDDESVDEVAPIRVESELVDGARLLTNVAVQNWRRRQRRRVRAGTWRGQPVAVKLLRQGGVLAARSRRSQGGGAPVRSAAAQEHRRLPRHLGSSRRAAAS